MLKSGTKGTHISKGSERSNKRKKSKRSNTQAGANGKINQNKKNVGKREKKRLGLAGILEGLF